VSDDSQRWMQIRMIPRDVMADLLTQAEWLVHWGRCAPQLPRERSDDWESKAHKFLVILCHYAGGDEGAQHG